MQVYFRLLTIFLLVFVSTEINAQVRAFDKLEILYDQDHYSMVYCRANRLLDKPDYDYSLQPEFYKSLAMFHLSRQDFWSQIHPNSLQDARKFSSVCLIMCLIWIILIMSLLWFLTMDW